MSKTTKMLKLAAAVAVTAGTLSLATTAFAADGTITFNGSVSTTTCDVAVNGGSANETVQLQDVNKSALKNLGDTADKTSFTIGLSNCSADTDVAVKFASSNVDTGNVGTLKNTDTGGGAATNVNFQLLKGDSSTIDLGNQGSPETATINSGSATLSYFVRYYATGTATSGTVASSTDYTVIYP